MTTIGIIGAGQLGQMMGYAAKELGVKCVFLDPQNNPPASSAGDVLKYDFDDLNGLHKLAEKADIVTYEFENVSVSALKELEKITTVFPPIKALSYAQDRLHEKNLFQKLSIPIPKFKIINSESDLKDAANLIGLPMILKTRRFGYDGKGQYFIKTLKEIPEAFSTLKSQPLIVEEYVPFDYELSAIGARNINGDIIFYPLTENRHREGILRESRAPAYTVKQDKKANDYLTRLLISLDYVGILALELFFLDGKILANEFAPRVHNSGHWTIEGSETSQFENHLRAILNLSLGSTKQLGIAGMVNIIGKMPKKYPFIKNKNQNFHNYNKSERKNRKLGHITVIEKNKSTLEKKLSEILDYLKEN